MVAGRIVVESGRVTTVDEAAIRAEARELSKSFAADRAAGDADAQAFLPYYRRMYLKAAAQDIGLQRWVGQTRTTART
jgi:5-methylthioadenosine/S-adenosylhomocysteine deaminase